MCLSLLRQHDSASSFDGADRQTDRGTHIVNVPPEKYAPETVIFHLSCAVCYQMAPKYHSLEYMVGLRMRGSYIHSEKLH